jgi:hypothetical protein
MVAWRRTGWLAGAAACAALSVACNAGAPPMRACTEIGSPAGLSVTVERDAVVEAMQLILRVCQADCVERRVDLQPGSITVGETCTSDDPDGSCSASASPDGTMDGFVDVPTLTAGQVRVSGELRTPSGTTELDEVTVAAAATYPNGRDCPAGGPQAALRVTSNGLR